MPKQENNNKNKKKNKTQMYSRFNLMSSAN